MDSDLQRLPLGLRRLARVLVVPGTAHGRELATLVLREALHKLRAVRADERAVPYVLFLGHFAREDHHAEALRTRRDAGPLRGGVGGVEAEDLLLREALAPPVLDGAGAREAVEPFF